ncbi:hypothetical protein QL093DRAFT_2105520 [Fusarium oxysporum]|nr:hypothetical protein QL093DRAFT_2105520 [Fusarium oxysporum]
MSLQEPSDRERRMYYCGLPSGPKLVARSSITPWFQPHEWPKNKRLDVATGHKIQQLWNDPQGSLRKLIIGTSAASTGPPLTSCALVTMLISVTENSTSFRQAEATIIACKDILIRFGLNDVEVEMKESIVSTTASTPGPATSGPSAGQSAPRLDPGPFDNDINDTKYDFFRGHLRFKEGTKGLYLQGNNGKTYALACRHSLFSAEYFKEYRYYDGSDTKYVLQPGSDNLSKLVGRFKGKKEAIDETIKEMAKPAYDAPEFQEKLPDFLQEQTLLQSCQPRMEQFDNEACAVIGRVEFSPPIELCSQRLRLRDWALVELAQDSFTTKLRSLPLRPRWPVGYAFSASNELAIGPIIIPGSEQDPPGLVVLKHGRTTGFTIGRANGVHSVLRHAFEIAEEVISSEWCIVGLGNAFSDRGDSGAVVFDLEGRVGGMITAGLRKQDNADGFDVTYATPMQWLLDDIKRHGYDVELPN